MSDKNSGAVDITLSFLLGTATGFILGVLFAPASGEETRKKIKNNAMATGEIAKENYDKFSKEAEKSIHRVKEKTNEGVDAIKDFVDKKKEELKKQAS
ncbi:MAG: YtxH domain-containing protein [Candidatus Aminicenantaceae bacterium]